MHFQLGFLTTSLLAMASMALPTATNSSAELVTVPSPSPLASLLPEHPVEKIPIKEGSDVDHGLPPPFLNLQPNRYCTYKGRHGKNNCVSDPKIRYLHETTSVNRLEARQQLTNLDLYYDSSPDVMKKINDIKAKKEQKKAVKAAKKAAKAKAKQEKKAEKARKKAAKKAAKAAKKAAKAKAKEEKKAEKERNKVAKAIEKAIAKAEKKRAKDKKKAAKAAAKQAVKAAKDARKHGW
ncbi:hypothetical protein K504DRAFT_448757 [Pleomassaria siparia CBS 279.74]|uniref:Uncharacterized protein n=1 Tax=Pleomassaria siparia CBS 279.74 TaxID=1314801 RepID=A0A6G1JY26_9PLEO|nr:hypothetical protein K504DRAFT_448757 [Pleomassaria siparia CBS 279.74]